MKKPDYNKIYDIACEEFSDVKYLYFNQLSSAIGEIFDNAGVEKKNPIPNDFFIAVQNAIANEIYGGFEPDFQTEEDYLKWCDINNEHFIYMTEEEMKNDNRISNKYDTRCPYLDKNLPYLIYIK